MPLDELLESMGRRIDEVTLAALLRRQFQEALELYLKGIRPSTANHLSEAADVLFATKVQSFREALLGCFLAKISDPAIDVRLPYANQGANAFQGRAVDEDIVNPFLQEHQIPCSKGPYLAMFRRSVKFVPETRDGLRDKGAYDVFLTLLDFLENASAGEARPVLRLLLWKFIELREQGKIDLARIQRLSLDQYQKLIDGLLQVPSGGLLPVLLSVAMFQTLRECFELDWEINWQAINAADRASGVGGDITIRSKGTTILAVEVTERVIEKSRLVATFNTKVAVHGLQDYLFLFTDSAPEAEARVAAQQYFGQGHDISFLPIASWLVSCLGTIGPGCRRLFNERVLALMDQPTVPAHVKIAWNETHAMLLQ